jgi:hypothetical protein
MIWVFYLRFTCRCWGVFYGTSLDGRRSRGQDRLPISSRARSARAQCCSGNISPTWAVLSLSFCVGDVVYLLVVPMPAARRSRFIDLVKDLVAAGVGLAVYGRLFAFVGAKFKRPLCRADFHLRMGQAALAFPGYLKRFTSRTTSRAGPRTLCRATARLSLIQGSSGKAQRWRKPYLAGGDSGGFRRRWRVDGRAAGIRFGTVGVGLKAASPV